MTALFDRLRGWGWRGWAVALIVVLGISLAIGLAGLLAPLVIVGCFVIALFLPVLRFLSAIVMFGSSIFLLANVYHNHWSWAGVSLLVLIVSCVVAGLVELIGYQTGFAGPSDPYAWWYRKDRSPP